MIQQTISRRGIMLILSSPSGAGKTTIAKRLLEKDDNLNLSISYTTREKRPVEEHGKDYFFTDTHTFQRMEAEGAFLEHAKVFDNYYGTPKSYVFDTLEQGKDILFDIDWQGTQQIAQDARSDLVSVFILPPDMETLYHRLRGRGQDQMYVIQNRMSQAVNEMSHWPEYDYVIVNDHLEDSLYKVECILEAERLRRSRQKGLVNFVKELGDGTKKVFA